MRKIAHVCLLLSLAFLLLTGATCPHKDNQPPDRGTPAQTMDTFRQALEDYKYTTAYECLSKNTRRRYPKDQFQMMLEWTIFGILLRNMLIKWDVTDTQYDSLDKNKAIVILSHGKYPEYQKDFIFVYERKGWRIDITMARLLGVPQEDEDNIGLSRKKRAKKAGRE